MEGLKIVVDCGHGAAYKVVPAMLTELGADVLPIGVQPDGENINRRCGALYPETAREMLLHEGADFAVALDGDADRAVFIDDTGEILDGDQVLAISALDMQEKGILKGNGLVATVMSNLGLELAMRKAGLEVVRAQVGDRYVVEKMLAGNFNLGGEQSGHILYLDHNSTGDGAITCLQMLAQMVEKRKRLSELKTVMDRLPQVLINIKVKEKKDFEQMPKVTTADRRDRAQPGRARPGVGALFRHRAVGAGDVGRRGRKKDPRHGRGDCQRDSRRDRQVNETSSARREKSFHHEGHEEHEVRS